MRDWLNGRTVLVVEDEYFLADDVRRGLEAAGAVVLGPVATLAAALRLIDGRRPDFAVLDINLRGRVSYEAAERLLAQDVPFVFATAYDKAMLPPQFRETPRLVKPYGIRALLAALEKLADPC